jgi:hypothetical protein
VTVIVEVPVVPVSTATLVGLPVTVKAVPTVYVTDAECDNPLPVPVTVTLNDPEATRSVHDRVEVPEVLVLLIPTLPGVRVHVSPTFGEIVSVKAIVPEKP